MTAPLFDRICFRLCVAEDKIRWAIVQTRSWWENCPSWFRITRNAIGFTLVFCLVWYCLVMAILLLPDSSY